MKTKFRIVYVLVAIAALMFNGCGKEGPMGPTGPQGPAGQDGINGQDTVIYSEWFSPSDWTYDSGSQEWYFDASAPDLTKSVVENGVVLAYCWLAGDVYNATAIRPLPAYALNASWSFLVYQYGSIEFTCDATNKPATTGNLFRFIAIPGNLTALKSALQKGTTLDELKQMSYAQVCKMFKIPQ